MNVYKQKIKYITPKVQINLLMMENSIASSSAILVPTPQANEEIILEWNDNVETEKIFNW